MKSWSSEYSARHWPSQEYFTRSFNDVEQFSETTW